MRLSPRTSLSPLPRRLPRDPNWAEAVEVAGLRRRGYPSAAFATEATWCSTHQPEHQQSSSNSTMARVLLLAASAAALRPTLPRRSRTTTRAALTMHDYDYDAGSSAYIKLSTAEFHAIDATPAPASLIDLRAGDHCRLRRRRPRRRLAREEPGPQDVRLVGRRRRWYLCEQRLRAEQGVASCFGTCPRNERRRPPGEHGHLDEWRVV